MQPTADTKAILHFKCSFFNLTDSSLHQTNDRRCFFCKLTIKFQLMYLCSCLPLFAHIIYQFFAHVYSFLHIFNPFCTYLVQGVSLVGWRCGMGLGGWRSASSPFVRLMTAAKAAITFITLRRQGAPQLNPHPPLAVALSGCSLLS